MYYYDSTFIVLIPALLLSLYAQAKIQSTYSRYSRQYSMSGLTGAEAARKILDLNGLYDVAIEVIPGNLTDHYDPRNRVLRLSREVFYGNSIAAIGVAAHEAGHALQHNRGYAPLIFRNALVPVANIGSNLSWILIMLGFIINSVGFINLGILLFSAVVLFQVVTLPVEFNASSRALTQLDNYNILYGEEIYKAKRVLNAAALTYVAATIMAVSQLLRLILLTRDSRD
ncbi:zinc metallopeptidase [Thermobrachium celere]|uniref:Probable metal-dependent peptidase n=1 Tax=Thermobrachium celere DSM 8682 TaxID=941824 RepID=R7RRG6_9CLOT|nr:zinc metallopeptidase [Thermobrachium celere]GFR35063.1 neutral zinc metallopeptidase [Thermobrachium celere]CDF57888.1 probable metal-dependent peptidase [Thermobrachium celere DSM 8682]